MSTLPSKWMVTNAIEVAEPIRGVTYKKENTRESPAEGFTAVLRANNIQRNRIEQLDLVYVPDTNISENQRLRRNDVVMAMSSGSISVVGKSAQVLDDIHASFGAFCGALRPSSQIVPKYLGHFLKSDAYRSAISNLARGVNINNLKWSHFEEIDLPLAPFAEQKRIADKLDAVLARVDVCRERLDRVPLILKRFRQAVLAAATSGQLTAEWRNKAGGESALQQIENIKLARPEKYRSSDIFPMAPFFEVPSNWAWAPLSFLFSPNESFCYGVVQPGDNDPLGVFLIRAGDLSNGSVETGNLRRIPYSVHNDFSRSKVLGGEILVTVVGAGIGETAIVQEECIGFNIARAVAKLPIREFSARYAHFWLSTSFALQWMKGQSREVARPTLNLEQLKALPVPIPPLDEQHEVVRRVDALFEFAERLENRLANARASTDRLTPAILAKAFRGELVPQDPNDEPASELLKRLAANRAATIDKPRRGRTAKS